MAPSNVRFVVIEAKSTAHYAPLAKAEPVRVVETACELDVLGALDALAEGAADGTPSGEFRRLQTRCATKLASGDLDGAKVSGAQAANVARGQGWPHLAAVISLMLAGGSLAARRPHEALAAYAEAETLGAQRRALEEKDLTEPAYGTRIRLQARLGQGAVLLACGAYEHAAAKYEQAAELAHDLTDVASELDAHRLTSFCRVQLGETDAAWDCGLRGLKVGVAMDDAQRRSSTLAYLADHLLRLTERDQAYGAQRTSLEEQFIRLLGPKWRDELVKAA
jgi:tetratricopeptide (TPR) repeat protein